MPNRLNKKFVFAAVIILTLIGVIFARPIYPQASPRVIQGIGVNMAQAIEEGQEIKTDIKNQQTDPSKLPDLSKDAQNKALGQQADARKAANEPSDKDLYLPVLFHIIGGILYVVSFVFSQLVVLAAKLANAVLGINHFTDVDVVIMGWEITRGLCNMIFALVLLILAFDTVLQTEYMGARRTLVRLVVIALLINFSLMLSGIIIDFSQVLTEYFIKAAVGSNGDVGLKLAGALNLSKVWQPPGDTSTLEAVKRFLLGPPLSAIVSLLMACIVLAIAAFTFFAFSFFLLVRVVWLWLLLILAPLAWASYVAPNLASSFGGGWEKWWKEFLKWSFFAPAYAFFLYLALTIAQNGLGFNVNKEIVAKAGDIPIVSSIFAGFFRSFDIILQYIVVIMILLAGLAFAQKAGAYGASAVMNSVKNVGNKVGDWSKRQAKRPGYYATDKASQWGAQLGAKTLTGISKTPLLRRITPGAATAGRRLEAKATQLQRKQIDRKQNKSFGDLLQNMSAEGVIDEALNAWGVRGTMAAEVAQKKGFFTKEFNDDAKNKKAGQAAKKGRNAFRRLGMHVEADALEETRLDIVKDKDLKKRIKDGITNGNFSKNKASSFLGENSQKIVEAAGQMVENDEIPRTEMAIAHKKLAKSVQDTFNKAALMTIQGNTDLGIVGDTEYKKIGLRHIYAGATSDINGAFSGDDREKWEKHEREYSQSLGPKEIGAFTTKTPAGQASLETIGKYITEGQLAGIRGEVNGLAKTLIMQGAIKAGRRDELIDNSPMWSQSVIKAIEKVGKQIENKQTTPKINERPLAYGPLPKASKANATPVTPPLESYELPPKKQPPPTSV
ncbi:MAG: hypothetical protein COS30_00310 [Candidatus Portnoybacteria bacterium CG02_land_8_20_14_3_00_45_8]|uniref:Uncharacterized protein n=1 Tax=Candidatus Portnoybacteria bacterium CG02_land_8_20_14_3_00_45_8 TaxID=1974807 RepID=A0A2M7D6Y1_9BACT|nr:MAG: hypothetical protein COS30_00310 [Candidatus Portnoybacteria bacterium CG02_land_8_20_14_3_00_45_8]